MLRLTTDMTPPSVEERRLIMENNIARIGIPVDYDRLIEYRSYFSICSGEVVDDLLKFLKCTRLDSIRTSFKSWVKSNGLTVGFSSTTKGGLSISDSSLEDFINTNYYGDEVTNKVKLFQTYLKYDKLRSSFEFALTFTKPCGLESEDGRRIALVKPDVVSQNTGRFAFQNPAFQNFPRFCKDIVVAPKGWTIISADSGQIEPKLIYGFYLPDKQIQELIKVYGDAYFAVLHYCTMPQADINNGLMNFTKHEITDEMASMRQRLKTYGNGVMYGSTSNPDKDSLKQSYIDRIGKHYLRVQWQNRVEKELSEGKKVFKTIFGTPIDIYQSTKVRNALTEDERRMRLIHCAINNPVQGSAADLMGFSLRATNDLFRRKAPNSWITKFVHDEGQYCVYNDELDYVLEELQGHTAYNINDVVEIYNDPVFKRKISYDMVPYSYHTAEAK